MKGVRQAGRALFLLFLVHLGCSSDNFLERYFDTMNEFFHIACYWGPGGRYTDDVVEQCQAMRSDVRDEPGSRCLARLALDSRWSNQVEAYYVCQTAVFRDLTDCLHDRLEDPSLSCEGITGQECKEETANLPQTYNDAKTECVSELTEAER